MQENKKVFRKQMLAKRDAIPEAERRAADGERNRRICEMSCYRKAELLLFYVSYRSEADTHILLRKALQEGKVVAVPKVEGQDLVFYRITAWSELAEGYRGILEPDTGKAEPVDDKTYAQGKTVLFVPGCAFDEQGGRMGYGGGFYDRFLEEHPQVGSVALGFEEQLVENVPREEHDKCVDWIVTEKRVIKTGKRPDEKQRR